MHRLFYIGEVESSWFNSDKLYNYDFVTNRGVVQWFYLSGCTENICILSSVNGKISSIFCVAEKALPYMVKVFI